MKMLHGKKVLLLFLLAAIAQESNASSWSYVGGNDNISAYVDTQSIRRSGSKVKVWTKWVYSQEQKIETTYPVKTYISTRDLSIYHCVNRAFITTQSTKYSQDETVGVVESQSYSDNPSMYDEVVPDSIGESILELVCKSTNSKKK